MLTPKIALGQEVAQTCRACSGTITRGQAVLEVYMRGNNVPFDLRRVYLHVSCTERTLVDAPHSWDYVAFAEAQERIRNATTLADI